LLTDRIDPLVWHFRQSQPAFYDQYQVARSIVDPPTFKKVIVPPPAANPLPQAA